MEAREVTDGGNGRSVSTPAPVEGINGTAVVALDASQGVYPSDGRVSPSLGSVEVLRPGSVAYWLKRCLDLCLAVPALVLSLPLMALIAVVIKLDSPGPVFFRSRRIGRRGQTFEMLKFRTMVEGADRRRDDLRPLSDGASGLFKLRNDPRVTRVGQLLRRLYLDELPQLIQVVAGIMTIVGPRGLPPEEDALVQDGSLRRQSKPGITGPWQVAGSWRIPIARMVQLDNDYLLSWSIWADLALIARTIWQVIRGHGV